MVLPLRVSPAPLPGGYGSPFGAPVSQTLTVSAVVPLDYGLVLVETGSHDTVEQVIATGTTIAVLGTAAVGLVVSDGTNTNLVNNGTTGTATTTLSVLGL